MRPSWDSEGATAESLKSVSWTGDSAIDEDGLAPRNASTALTPSSNSRLRPTTRRQAGRGVRAAAVATRSW